VAQKHRAHVVRFDPVDPDLRVDLRPVVVGEEAVGFEAARGHQDEDAERRVAEPEPFRLRLRVEADHQIDALDIPVDPAQLLGRGGIAARHLLEGLRCLEMEQTPELVVAWHASLARAHDVDGSKVEQLAVGTVEALETARVVVETDRTRVGDAERVERVGERDLFQALADVQRVHLLERAPLKHAVVGEGIERVVVGDQRVHPVHADELLGQRVRDAEQLFLRPRDAVEELGARTASEGLVEALAEDPEPVRAQPAHGGRVGDDRRRPVDRVDLGHQRGVDEARFLVEGLVVELGVLGVQPFADRVVLEHEEGVQEREADPEVAGDAAQVDVGLDVLR
jgi:hypothetical protein